MRERKFLLHRGRKDKRDLRVSTVRLKDIHIPSSVDMRDKTPAIYDQGDVGLCFAHAGCRCFDMDFNRDTGKFMTPSRLFLGVTTRMEEGTLGEDNGATIRGTCKALAKYGVPPESLMLYDTSKMYDPPQQDILKVAEKYQALKYFSINPGNLTLMKQTLASGFPFMFGAYIYQSFESPYVAETGRVPMPRPREYKVGGHALTAVGYSDAEESILVANSWGVSWGLDGYCWMPYSYFTRPGLVFDIWVITQTELGT